MKVKKTEVIPYHFCIPIFLLVRLAVTITKTLMTYINIHKLLIQITCWNNYKLAVSQLHVLWLCLAGLAAASFLTSSFSSTLAQAPLKVEFAVFFTKIRETSEAKPHKLL